MIVTCIIAVYAVSAVGMWRYIHLAHGPNGIWEWSELDRRDILMTLCPVLNTLANLGWFVWPVRRTDANSDRIKKFFRLK